MSCRTVFTIATLLLPCVTFAQKQEYAIPLQKDVPAYLHQMRKAFEKPAFAVNAESRLIVTEKGMSAVQVQDPQGRVGWVELRLVKVVNESRMLRFEAATVERYADMKDLIWVPGDPKVLNSPMVLDRSFADAMKENVDRESIERQAN
jgi:hypothetical protein